MRCRKPLQEPKDEDGEKERTRGGREDLPQAMLSAKVVDSRADFFQR